MPHLPFPRVQFPHVLRFLPPLVIGEDLLNEGLDIIEQAFARI
ncbi:4-aminobutyrate aminotransferase [Streptomyces lincolnensis]|nr:hypothetical protein [Streptomyces lincolnensis]AXG53475.1 4-aminobutyrate aminotransferase [Streptomyces lincolnensis]